MKIRNQNLGKMKKFQPISGNVALAQVKPAKIKGFFIKSLMLLGLIAISISSVSYIGWKRPHVFSVQELYGKQVSNGLKNFFSLSQEQKSRSLNVPQFVYEFYDNNGYKPVWTHNHSISFNAMNIIELLDKAEFYGLNRKFYHINTLLSLKENIENAKSEKQLIQSRNAFELLLTDASFSFIINLNRGLMSYDSLVNDAYFKDLPGHFYDVCKNADVNNVILSYQPKNKQYVNLQKSLQKYLTEIDLTDNKFEIYDFRKDPIISKEQTKNALFKLGYLSSDHCNDSLFISALSTFQVHNGLKPDGKISKNTRDALSFSTRERFFKIAVNLDRIRKEKINDESYIFVNIPSYKLIVFDKNIVKEEFTVVVGDPETPTPEFSSMLDKIIANPNWSVPTSITKNEILPKVKEDSTYIARHNFKVVDKYQNDIDLTQIKWQEADQSNFSYYFIQNSGYSNSLGLLKFTFNNPYSIYIHDTPSKKHFNYEIRAFSHGCIRLQEPQRLAKFLIDNNLVNDVKPDIDKLIAKKKNEVIELSRPMPIHIKYLTCEADDNGNIYFYRDIYNKDNLEAFSILN